jgi:hypothetical protein
MADNLRPADNLVGKRVVGQRSKKNWEIIRKIVPKPGRTRNTFSVCYIAKDEDGIEAFFKATDVYLYQGVDDAFARLQMTISEQGFERNILDVCRGNNMDRIVTCIDHGEFFIDFESVRNPIFFLIFELAQGDVREKILDADK